MRAAVSGGADAIYLGYGNFNARRNARNFTEEEFAQTVSYCHVRGVKVYLTLNTLVSDRELPAAVEDAARGEGLGRMMFSAANRDYEPLLRFYLENDAAVYSIRLMKVL